MKFTTLDGRNFNKTQSLSEHNSLRKIWSVIDQWSLCVNTGSFYRFIGGRMHYVRNARQPSLILKKVG